MKVNIVGETLAPGVSAHLFGGPFQSGVLLSILTFRRQVFGKVLDVTADERVLIEIEGEGQWWLKRDVGEPRYRSCIGPRPETWIVATP